MAGLTTWSLVRLFTSCLKSPVRNFSKRPPSSHLVRLDVCLELSLASRRWKPEASGWLKLTSVSSKKIYLTHEPSTFSVTGQTPRRPANSVKITFRKRHLASTDTLTGSSPVSPHQSAARWGPDAIPRPASRSLRPGRPIFPMGYVPNPALLLPTRSWLLIAKGGLWV